MPDLCEAASTRRDRSGDRLEKMRWHALRQVRSIAEPKALPSPFLEFPGTASPEEIERWQQAWDEIISADGVRHRQIIHVPGRFTFLPRVRKSAPRGLPRMRAQLGRSRDAAERRMHRLILRSWMNRGAYSTAEVRSGFGLPAADQFIDACLPIDWPTFPGGETTSERMGRLLRWAGFDKPIEPYDLSAPADILVELPEPLTDPLDAVEHIISGSPLYARHRGDAGGRADSRLSPAAHAWLAPPSPNILQAFIDHELIEPAAKGAFPPERGPWWHWAVAAALGIATFAVVLHLTLNH